LSTCGETYVGAEHHRNLLLFCNFHLCGMVALLAGHRTCDLYSVVQKNFCEQELTLLSSQALFQPQTHQYCCLAAGLHADPTGELKRYPDLFMAREG